MKLVVVVLALLLSGVAVARGESSIYDIPLVDIDGKETSLAEYRGKRF